MSDTTAIQRPEKGFVFEEHEDELTITYLQTNRLWRQIALFCLIFFGSIFLVSAIAAADGYGGAGIAVVAAIIVIATSLMGFRRHTYTLSIDPKGITTSGKTYLWDDIGWIGIPGEDTMFFGRQADFAAYQIGEMVKGKSISIGFGKHMVHVVDGASSAIAEQMFRRILEFMQRKNLSPKA